MRSAPGVVLVAFALVLDPSGAAASPFAYVANNDSSDVSVIDTTTNVVVDTIPLPGRGRGAVLSPDGSRLYVTMQVFDAVAVIDTFTNAVVTNVPIGPFPVGFPNDLALNAAGTRLYVTAGCCNVVAIDTTTNTAVATIPTLAPGSPELKGIAIDAAGTRVYATEKNSDTLFVIDATTNTLVTAVPGGGNGGVVVDSVAGLVYATRAGTGTVEVTDTTTNTVVDSIPIGCTAARLVQNAARTRLYVTCATGFPGDPLKVVDLGTSTVIATIPLGRGPQGVDITPDDAFVYAANILDDDVSVIETATNTVVDTIPVGVLPIANGRFIGHEFVCGNGTREPGEECDDGGTSPGDGCDALCVLEGCPTRVGVTATKLVVADKLTATGNAKFVFVAKDQTGAITKGAGTDVEGIAVELNVGYADGSAVGAFVVPLGASDGTAGWLVNKAAVAKYVNKSAPGGPTGTKVAVVKPGKLLKLVGKGLGDVAFDILGAGAPSAQPAGEVVTAYRVTNDGAETCHCSAFADCSYKAIAGGTGAKLVCKAGVPDAGCTAFTGP